MTADAATTPGTALFRSGLERLLEGSQRMNIALMCVEKDPLDCHRTILVARELISFGKRILHILADGSLETHEASIKRLWEQLGLVEEDFFRTPTELEDEAYTMQEERIAYVNEACAYGAQEG